MRKLLPLASSLALSLALVIGALGAPSAALANMAAPWKPGDVVGEPRGAAKSVAIVREELAIDLRPLAAGERAQVSATYRVRNDGAAQSMDLLFIAPTLAEGAKGTSTVVLLDGTPIASRATRPASLPDSWQPPKTTPALRSGDESFDYQTSSQDNRALTFTLALSPGPHEVRVSYQAVATARSGDSPVAYWQLGYVLAPARDWASFGGLDVRVELPAGWAAASEPALARSGDVLAGSFDAIPADALALTAQAPVPTVIDAMPPAWVGGLVVSLVVGMLVGRWLGHRRRSSLWALIPALLVGIAWMAAVIVAGGIQYVGSVPNAQRAWTYGYGEQMIGLLTSPFALLGGIIFTQLAAVVAKRRTRTLAPAPERA